MTPLFPTAYFGSIAYFQQLLRYSSVTIEVCDTFPKQTFRNRCTILGPQGEHRLTLPVERPGGSKSVTGEILVSDTQDWRSNHWRAIRSNYAAAPYFEHYAREIEELIFTKERNLVAFNMLVTQKIAGLFGFDIDLKPAAEFIPPTGDAEDFRAVAFDDPAPEGFEIRPYTQVLFEEAHFQRNPSVLDLLFCEGPMGRKIAAFEKN
jgi:hypothetical protein